METSAASEQTPLRLVEDTPEWDFELTANGYDKGTPSPVEQDRINREIGQKLDNAIKDSAVLFKRAADNIENYRGKSQPLPNQKGAEALTLPMVGRVVDQIVAWETVQTLKASPIVSFDPYEDDSYDVLLPVEVEMPQQPTMPMMGNAMPEMGMGGMMGGEMPMMGGAPEMGMPPGPQMMRSQTAEAWTSEDLGHNAEIWWDFKLRERYGARQLFKNAYRSLHTESAAYAKVTWDKQTREVYATKFKRTPGSNLVEIVGDEKKTVTDGDPLRVELVPYFNLVWPVDQDDLQVADFVAETLGGLSDFEMQRRRQSGEYALPNDEKWEGILKSVTTEYRAEADAHLRKTVEGLSPSQPTALHDVREVHFFWPVKVKMPGADGKVSTKILRMSLQGDYHLGARQFLCIYKNPYRHGRRPYAVAYEDAQAGRRNTSCLVEKLAKHQRIASQMLHITLQNKIKAGNWNPWGLEGTPAYDAITSENYPGKPIPGKFGDEWGYAQGGLEHSGLMNEINFVMNDLMETANMSPAQMGATISNRTAASAVQQVMEAGLLKPVLWLGVMSDFMAEIVRLAIEVQRQFDPFGETVPFRDPDTRKFIEIQMRFPTEPVFDRFHIALTAAEQELAKEADQAENIMVASALRESSAALAQIAGAMASMDASPELTALFGDLVRSELEMRKMTIGHRRRDLKKLVPAAERIEALKAEKLQAIQMMQQQQAAMGAMGGMNGAAPGTSEALPPNGPGGPGAGMAPVG